MDHVEPESPWALQLVARVEKEHPPSTASVCAAAALVTIELLDDERSKTGGIWHESVARWNGARIRKIVRRARGAAWNRVLDLEGVTIERAGTQVRAFVPCPMDQAPAELSRLQIQSTPLDEVAAVHELAPLAPHTLVIAITPHFAMSWGKQAAQSAHAGQLAWQGADHDTVTRWTAARRPLVVIHPDVAFWSSLEGLATTRIHDGGFTEIPPGTNSALAWFAGGELS